MVKKGAEIPSLQRLLRLLEKTASAQPAPVWKRVAYLLSRPTRQRVEVNLVKLDRLANDSEILLVPGKVLGLGTPGKKFAVAAWRFAKPARAKLERAGCTALSIEQVLEKNPKGSKIRLVI